MKNVWSVVFEGDKRVTLLQNGMIISFLPTNEYHQAVINVLFRLMCDAGLSTFDFDTINPNDQSQLIAYVDYADEIVEIPQYLED